MTTAIEATGMRSTARLRDLIPAEWIKLRSLRSTLWTLGMMAAYAWYIAYSSCQRTIDMTPNPTAQDRAGFLFTNAVFFAPAWFPLMIGAGAVGAMVVSGEHASGLIRTTFTAVPDRTRVIAAKIAVVFSALTIAGLVSAVGCYIVGLAMLSSRYPGASLTSPDSLRGIAFTTLLFPLSGLAGLALAALIRNVPGTLLAVVGVFAFLPLGLKSDLYWWMNQGKDCMPWYSWWTLIAETNGPIADKHVETFTHAWLTFAGWFLASVVIAPIALHRREL